MIINIKKIKNIEKKQQIPNRCYCSNEVDTNKAVRLRRCYAVCPGDQNPCGGYKLYSVYKSIFILLNFSFFFTVNLSKKMSA